MPPVVRPPGPVEMASTLIPRQTPSVARCPSSCEESLTTPTSLTLWRVPDARSPSSTVSPSTGSSTPSPSSLLNTGREIVASSLQLPPYVTRNWTRCIWLWVTTVTHVDIKFISGHPKVWRASVSAPYTDPTLIVTTWVCCGLCVASDTDVVWLK